MTTENKPKTEKKDNKAAVIALLLTTLLFLGASGYLFYANTQVEEKNEVQASRIDSLNTLQKKMEKDVSAFQDQIKEYQGKSQELESQLAAANSEIEDKKERIRKLAASGASVKRLKKEAAELNDKISSYLRRISELDSLVASLRLENESLKARTVELDQQIATLQERNAMLEKKVQLASALKTSNVIVIGEKKGKKGYLPTTLKKAERLMITFDVMENKAAEPGEKSIYITVTNPAGKIIETSESGTFTNAENNVSTPYTLIHKFSYSNSDQKEAAHVELKKEERKPGNYTIEFYCDGLLCGIKQVAIK